MPTDGEPYYPSNGTEGYSFVEEFCMNCIHCNPDPGGKKQCGILLATLTLTPKDKDYPKEWVYHNGQPVCDKYKHWDWDVLGDPDDPDNPNKAPDPPDPCQMSLFTHIDVAEKLKRLR
jgi:hypothetical protein